ncbi:MAG TPA: hypothetical protein VNG89_03990 [Vicinamibacterales bacterium]|nr:hypothetical protein [Vicinamibacterales bacterium]
MSVQDENSLTAREQVEYTALRATIRERGTARVCVFAGGIVAWGALTIATAALAAAPVATLVPLVVLAAQFEAVFALHVGVERVGRYLQVFHEPAAERSGWEHAAMGFGRVPGAATTDALFTAVFLIAAACNIIPALIIGPTQPELIFVGGAHALFVIRLLAARAAAGRQRAIDLRRFEDMKATPAAVRPHGSRSADGGQGSRSG